MRVLKVLLPPPKIRIFGPKTARFGPKLAFKSFWSNIGLSDIPGIKMEKVWPGTHMMLIKIVYQPSLTYV